MLPIYTVLVCREFTRDFWVSLYRAFCPGLRKLRPVYGSNGCVCHDGRGYSWGVDKDQGGALVKAHVSEPRTFSKIELSVQLCHCHMKKRS